MLSTKKIGFAGVCKYDLCIYLGTVLHNLQYRVLIIDNSHEQQMKFCIPKPDLPLKTYSYRGVDYQFQIPVDREPINNYDFVLVDLGTWMEERTAVGYDEVFLVTDGDRRHVEMYRELLTALKRPVSIILRDVCEYKITASYLMELLVEEPMNLVEKYVLRQDELDYEYRIRMQYEGCQDFRKLSASLEHVIVDIARNITSVSWMDASYAFRAARKGACI